jgi:polar amino acid transport system substrate-binding protein
MKRLVAIAVVVAFGAAAFAAWSIAAPTGAAGHAASVAKAPKFPPLPAEPKSRKRWLIGVKCDFPPFGFIDVRGKHDGYDVQIARRFAELAFGKTNRVSMTCVTTPSRIPTLISGRVDMIISTLTWTAARAEQIDFSIPYYSATGRLLVKNDSTLTLSGLAGKTVATTRGSIYGTWVRNCFKNTKLLEVDSPAAATLAVQNGQADTFMFDDAFLLGVATQDPTLKLTKDKFLNIPWGIGIRKGDTATANWVNAALRFMKRKDEFVKIMKANAPARLVSDFLDNVPRPKNTFAYPVGKDLPSTCP